MDYADVGIVHTCASLDANVTLARRDNAGAWETRSARRAIWHSWMQLCGMHRPPPAATRVPSAPAAVAGSMPEGAPLFVTGTDGAVPDALSITVASSGAGA